MKRIGTIFASAATAAVLAGSIAAALPAGATAAPNQTLTASTSVTGHADSGTKGDNWNSEKYKLTLTVTRADQKTYPEANCGSASTDTGKCYKWVATETFSNGGFTTIPGQLSPRTGADIGVAASGTFSGWVHSITLFSSWKGVYAKQARIPAKHDDGGTKGSGDFTVSRWPALAFGGSASVDVTDFGSATAPYWFKYSLPFGADNECPNVGSQWIDSVPWMNDGAKATAGDILAPSAAAGC